MKNKVRVVLIDSDKEQLRMTEKYFSSHAVIEVVKSFNDGMEASKYVLNNMNSFDVVVTDLILTNKDGMSIIKSIRDKSVEKGIIVLTGYNSLAVIKEVSLYKINYFMLKPFNYKDLENQILDIDTRKISIIDYDIELQNTISDMLHTLGVPSHIKGFQYIREGIGLLYSKPSILGAITKEMYPEIAVKYNTTSSRVERAIRHAIEISWNRGDYDLMEDLFGNSVDVDRSKPTNSEFIATLADKLRLQHR